MLLYTALMLTPESVKAILAVHPAKHPVVYAHHTTLVFQPGPAALGKFTPYIGRKIMFTAVGYAEDVRGQALKVEVPDYLQWESQLHHVTISCAEGVRPVYGGELLKLGWASEMPFKLEGYVEHFLQPDKKPKGVALAPR